MSKRVFSGKTVSDAVNKGLAELGVTEDRVKITVLEHPSKGILGLFGMKDAKVELEVIEVKRAEPVPEPVPSFPEFDAIERSKAYLAEIVRDMGIDATIRRTEDEDGNIVLEVNGKELGVFIGRRGQTMDAVQTLVNVYANRISGEHLRIVIDAERFRERRKKTLQDLSLRLANQVVRTRKEVVLEPMSPLERRIIHYQLQNHPKVKTFSKGDEPNRRIVITLKS
ncbi:RNA-binding cell elongation regulator Jag/EloR [Paenibacillus sp.]|uniref:RNA-binding cell elongation regulator Jag/EloR n=1 Tax=Paenibacillus sp. TaxID=58172 RepID=UPI002D5BDB6E|nr:RNA-binding cell elongation regulator Jag/EloR [Paenibacillus sp.]HZG84900.1 RNA-binding cell elongation regulator Jag/EloR [Paenibacillus sp.]